MSEAAARAFGAVIQRLIQREDLAREECHAAFRQVLTGEQSELHQVMLLGKGGVADGHGYHDGQRDREMSHDLIPPVL